MFLSEYFLFNMVNLGIKTFTKICGESMSRFTRIVKAMNNNNRGRPKKEARKK